MVIDPKEAAARSAPGVIWGWLDGSDSGVIHGFRHDRETGHMRTISRCDGRGLFKEQLNGRYCKRCVKAALRLVGEL